MIETTEHVFSFICNEASFMFPEYVVEKGADVT